MPSVSSISTSGEPRDTRTGANGLAEEQQRQVEKLAKRDREVRQHEQAHLAAAGGYAKGGPTFSYTRGPDGRQYATGGEVQIDVSAEKTPEATIAKARAVQRAAQAPAEPSGADRAVAAAAVRMEAKARQDLARQRKEQAKGSDGPPAVAAPQRSYAESRSPQASGNVFSAVA